MYFNGNDFFRGVGYLLSGIREFWSRPRLWLYALVPLLCVKVVFSLVTWMVMRHWILPLESWMQGQFEVIGWNTVGGLAAKGVHWLCLIGLLMVMSAVASFLFELFGCFFFSRMVRFYEHWVYQRPQPPPLGVGRELLNGFDSIVYSLGTVLLYVPLMAIGIIFPLAGQLMTAWFIGYRYGVSYCAEAGFNRGMTIHTFQVRLRGRRPVLYGFGVAVFVILLIPFLSILLIPGCVIGGTRLVNEEWVN